MNALLQSLQSVAQLYNGDKTSLTSACQAYQENGDEYAFAYMAVKVYPYLNKYRSDVVRIFGEAELEESFLHAVTYAAKKFKPTKNAKFETYFNWCLKSTIQQLYVASNSQRAKVNYAAANLDDLAFVLSDNGESAEEAAAVSWILDLFDESSDERKLLKLLIEDSGITATEACFELAYVKSKDSKREVPMTAVELKERCSGKKTIEKAFRELGIAADLDGYAALMESIKDTLAPHKAELCF